MKIIRKNFFCMCVGGGGQAWEPIYLPAVSWQAGVKVAFGMGKAAVEASWWQESLGQKPFLPEHQIPRPMQTSKRCSCKDRSNEFW